MPAPSFAELGVPADLVSALAETGVDTPFPIQAATLPDSLAGRDVLGRGRTGSGKTYAFLLPLLARLSQSGSGRRPGRPRALVLAPTRELVNQIEASIAPLAKRLRLRTMTVFGGVRPNPQINALRAGVDVLIACPGRLLDHLSTGHARLDDVEITVLDEADHMADLGFLPAVRKLLDATPADGQRMLFSATLDSGVDVLVRRYLTNPVTHSVDSAESPVATMTHHVLHVGADARLPVLVDLTAAPGRTLVFTRTKHGAKKLTKQLVAAGVQAVELHGNLGQTARTRNLDAFSGGGATALVATDIAARGIHVDDVSLVIHADPPAEHKAYLHRSGRTARAGASGTVVTLMTDAQVADVRDLTRKAGIRPRTTRLDPQHPLLAELAPGERIFVTPPPKEAAQPRRPRRPAAARGEKQGGRRGGEQAASRGGSGGGRQSSGGSGGSGGSRQGSGGGRRRAAAPSPGAGGAAAFSAGARSGRRRSR
ncbi:RNA helicase [Amycolatopsis antarctica]|uniref:RNA helicase n=2 Tax=Amycolatopsis antarctica TaxID=1854586 RepID=A0A263CW93_9PSEU|nr:DEAD/DEAH box helicase [Amycolatopsis antarctica]OZM70402.1 RNA helicase [Amycolatopsis antarctica]